MRGAWLRNLGHYIGWEPDACLLYPCDVVLLCCAWSRCVRQSQSTHALVHFVLVPRDDLAWLLGLLLYSKRPIELSAWCEARLLVVGWVAACL